MIAAMILSAGKATRLRPLTEACPKPLVPVGDGPAIAGILQQLAGRCGPVVVNAFHGGEQMVRFAASELGKASGLRVSVEETLAGTAGGVACAAGLLGAGPVLVWNGDILTTMEVDALLRTHAHGKGLATLAFRPGAPGTGTLGARADGRVVRLRQETVAPGEVFGGEFLGIHVLGEGLRGNLPREGCLVGDVYLPALRRGDHLDTFAHAEPFLDIGTVASYHAANMVWLDKHGVAGVHQGAQSLVEPQVTLVRSVLGKGAKARGAGLLDEVVVWPGAEVVAPLRRAVVMPQQVIVVP